MKHLVVIAVKNYFTPKEKELKGFLIIGEVNQIRQRASLQKKILNEVLQEMCEKPTPLSVGWIAQNIKIMCM